MSITKSIHNSKLQKEDTSLLSVHIAGPERLMIAKYDISQLSLTGFHTIRANAAISDMISDMTAATHFFLSYLKHYDAINSIRIRYSYISGPRIRKKGFEQAYLHDIWMGFLVLSSLYIISLIIRSHSLQLIAPRIG